MVDKEKNVCILNVFSSERTKFKQVQNDIGPTMKTANGFAIQSTNFLEPSSSLQNDSFQNMLFHNLFLNLKRCMFFYLNRFY